MSGESFESETELVREAARRTRWAGAALTVCAMCHVTIFYNAHLSWMKMYGDAAAWAYAERDKGRSEIKKKLHEAYIDKWVDSIYVDIPVLGVKVAGTDSSVVGAVAMSILSVWVFFSARRENHLVHLVLSDARRAIADPASKRRLLRGIVASQVLSPTSNDDTPHAAFSPSSRAPRSAAIPRAINRGLRFLPCVVILAGVGFDVYSAVSRGFLSSHVERIAPMMTVAVACAALCGYLAFLFSRFQRSTGLLVREFAVELDKSDTKPSVPPLRPHFAGPPR